jgi:hypothetical protein
VIVRQQFGISRRNTRAEQTTELTAAIGTLPPTRRGGGKISKKQTPLQSRHQDLAAAREVIDRTDGKAMQAVDYGDLEPRN